MYDYFLEASVAASMSEAELEKVSEANVKFYLTIWLGWAIIIDLLYYYTLRSLQLRSRNDAKDAFYIL